ncbi:MAG: diguanylate cyclase, partial [Pseudomonadota bacterium]
MLVSGPMIGSSQLDAIELDGDVIVDASATFVERLGYDRSDLIGQPLDMVVPGCAEDHLVELLIKFGLHQPLPPTRSVELKCSDGRLIPADARLLSKEPTLELGFECSSEAINRQVVGRYKDIYETVAEGIYRCSLDGIQMAANPALVRMNGYDTEAEMLRDVNEIDRKWYVDPNRRTEFFEALNRDGLVRDFVSEVYRFKSREKIWISENARLVRHDVTGDGLFYEGTIREVTSQVSSQEKSENHAKIAAQAPGLLFQSCLKPGEDVFFSFASEGCEDLCGLRPEELLEDAKIFVRRINPADRPRITLGIETSAKTMKPWSDEFRLRRMDGQDIWVGGTATPELQSDGTIVWHGFVNDITERKTAQAQIEKLAYQDSLTGLANRARLHSDGESRLQNALGANQSAALLFLDLDNFKSLNDLHGHRAGDDFLKETAGRIGNCISPEHLIVRLGGDEFVILMAGVSLEAAQAAAHRLVLELG